MKNKLNIKKLIVKEKCETKSSKRECKVFRKKRLNKEIIFNFNAKNKKCATSSNIRINDEFVDCLLDTGAFTSFISESYCNERNFKRESIEKKKNWVTANGSPIEVKGQVKLKLSIDEINIYATFIVAKDLTQNIIIGVDVLSPNKCIIDFSSNKLRVKGSHIEIETLDPPKTRFLHANSNIELNPFEDEVTWVKVDHNYEQVLITKAGKNNVVEMITKLENNSVPVFLTNPTNIPRTIRKGEIIAMISPVEIVTEIHNDAEMFEFIDSERDRKLINSISHEDKAWRPGDRLKITNKQLTEDQKQKVRDLINEYHMIFSKNDSDIGHIDKRYGQHDIKLIDETPITQKPYRTPYAKEEVIKNSISKMLDMKIVEQSDSDWSSPIVLVKKADGSERFCVDYRKLNAVTIKDRFPMPSIESKLNKLHGCKFFTTLDCTSGYWQISVSERAKQLIAFAATQGLFTFNYMPFGLCNAGATFQRVIEKIIKGIDSATAYIDDLLSFSKTFDLHLTHLRVLFERLKNCNIKVKTSKCKIACDELMFLGYKISDKGISIDNSRTDSLKNYPIPTKAKHVKQFLGMAGFYRHFIKNFADIVEPLNHLTRKHTKFFWSDDCNKAFYMIIKLLSDKPILAYPNFNEEFFLATDASKIGIGAVLGQKDSNNNEHPIYFASRALNQAERNYSTIERELLAIVYSVDKFRYYLYGKKFTIITDHNPLVYLKNITLSSERLTRWRLKLAEYDFDVVYRKGTLNANADAMSRAEIPEEKIPINDKLETLFHIDNYEIIPKEALIEACCSINDTAKEINYNNGNIFDSSEDEAIAVTIPANIYHITGVAKDICDTFGGISCLKKHNLKVGQAVIQKDTRTVFYLIINGCKTDTPSYENLISCFKNVKDLCEKHKIRKIAFPKYGKGLGKLCWNDVANAIQKTFADKVECTIYCNTTAPQVEINELDINSKIKKLQKKDPEINHILEQINRNKPVKGYVIQEGVLMKLRKGKYRHMYRQLMVPQEIRRDILKLCHDNFTGAHLGEKKTWIKLSNRFHWKNSYKETMEYGKFCEVCACFKDPPAT